MNIENLRTEYAKRIVNNSPSDVIEVLAFEYLTKDFENYTEEQLIREIKEAAPDLLTNKF